MILCYRPLISCLYLKRFLYYVGYYKVLDK
jgi:hypothetical protein